MASLRNLKKDIDFIICEIYLDAQLFLNFNNNKKEAEVQAIIQDASALRRDLFERANKPNGKLETKLVKEHYNSICKDLIQQSHKLFERLSALNK